jgi:2'-5' RNA ligase
LKRECGLSSARVAYPHFSYQVVESYDAPRVEPVLREWVREAKPFRVLTAGLGIFTGPRPVLYVRIVRSPELSAFHADLWSRVAPYAVNMHEQHYGHDFWSPHITLAIEDLTPDILPTAVRLLSERPFNWEIKIDNVALVLDARGDRDQWLLFPFGGT